MIQNVISLSCPDSHFKSLEQGLIKNYTALLPKTTYKIKMLRLFIIGYIRYIGLPNFKYEN